MSYAIAAALQAALYTRLTADAGLAALVGGAIYDALPQGTPPALYVTLGEEEVQARSDASGSGAWHRCTISVVSTAPGFTDPKTVAVAISDALDGAALSLGRGHLVALNFTRARAFKDATDGTRRIELIFRARVDDTP